jgi:NADPH:quinone reductase-like Zn-dependent oxidoreductase
MKSILHTKYGPPDVLQHREVEKPAPNENQILVKVHAASVNAYEYRTMRADPFLIRLMGAGFLSPKDPRFGSDVAGLVEAVGENVKQFRPGDEVFGEANGTFAEYVLARERYLARKPANLSFEEAAAVPVAGVSAPVIDRSYSLSKVPEAIRYIEERHAQGKVVITVEHESKT